ncbi:MAG: DNA mismatch repair endonuclease MutL, partial [Lachnospiraceae bacterium]|nr:DNA mismatch repair endonuclease MutL [Lachnospiraceae bacterium]
MAEIHILDSATIDKIAAGEVVERPVSVVKELVENAVDAGAKHISVEIKEGGISMIRVTDDGSGIEKSQLPKVFYRHATSKIETAEDLTGVLSLGFRGEALSSVAAVAKVELITKTEDELVGSRLEINGGKAEEPEEVGAPTGTTIVVRDLFFNTPVRKKFLKTANTEGSYVHEYMQHLALGSPNVAFQFVMNGQTRFFTSGNGDISEIIYRIWGKEVSTQLLPYEASMDGVTVRGYLGKPILARANRSFETLFVNTRFIKSALLSSAIEEGYRTLLMQHKYPFVVLHFAIDPQKLDVNVHPTKLDIRITEPGALLEMLATTIAETLKGTSLIQKALKGDEDMTPQQKREQVKAEVDRQKGLTRTLAQPFEGKRLAEESRYGKVEEQVSGNHTDGTANAENTDRAETGENTNNTETVDNTNSGATGENVGSTATGPNSTVTGANAGSIVTGTNTDSTVTETNTGSAITGENADGESSESTLWSVDVDEDETPATNQTNGQLTTAPQNAEVMTPRPPK